MSLRPVIEIDVSQSNETESFHHKTLRPILKFQNDAILKLFSDFIVSSKIHFSLLSKNQKYEFIMTSVKNDLNLKITLIGITVRYPKMSWIFILKTKKNSTNGL